MSSGDDDTDVAGMGKGFMDHSLLAVLFGAAAAFGGGALGARVPPKLPPRPMSPRRQGLSALVLYGGWFGIPLVTWFVTHDWIRTVVVTSMIWVGLFFAVGFVAVVVGYRRSRAGKID